jgi:triosephosphate isomerase
MNKKRFYIANWKMQWTFDETITFVTQNYDSLIQLTNNKALQVILCPSYPALYPLAEMFKTTNVMLGAQDCSNHAIGAFTGQISAVHLKSVGCTYCLVGHSERRCYNHETNATIAQKCLHLIAANITPILCVGETKEQQQAGETLAILEAQLLDVFNVLKQNPLSQVTHVLVAYEPVWAIGTSITPSKEHLETVFAWLTQATQHTIHSLAWHFLYGGGVNAHISREIITLPSVEGFLMGSASLDFQEFEKIVKYDN